MATPTYLPPSRIMGSIPISNTVNVMDFTAAGVKTQNVPSGANLVLIRPASGQDVFVKLGAAAAVPTGDITDGSGSAQDPTIIELMGAATISVATAAAGIVTLSFYS